MTQLLPCLGIITKNFNNQGTSQNNASTDSKYFGGPEGHREDWRFPSKDRPYYIYVDGEKLYVPEAIYDATVREEWRMKKEYELRTKCIITTEKGNTAVCRKSCAECPYYSAKRMNLISMDYMADEQGVDISLEAQSYVCSESPTEYASRIEREEAVREAIKLFKEPIDQAIIEFLKGELTLTEIAKKHHITMSSLFRRKEKIVKELQILLKNYKQSEKLES